MKYNNILIGIKTFSKSWLASIRRIHKPNIILADFNDELDLQNGLKKNINYILPLSKDDFLTIKDRTPYKILFPGIETFDLLDNKVEFIKFMMVNFKDYIPEVYYLDNVKLKDPVFPVVSKPRYSRAGCGVKICHTAIEISGDKTIVQKCIDEQYEYTGHVLCIDGKIINWKVIRFLYPKYNVKTTNFPHNYENITKFDMTIFSDIIKSLNYTGGMCIDFKLDNESKIKIFEINPRFGGSAFDNNFIYELLCFVD